MKARRANGMPWFVEWPPPPIPGFDVESAIRANPKDNWKAFSEAVWREIDRSFQAAYRNCPHLIAMLDLGDDE